MYNNNFINEHSLIYGNLIQCSIEGKFLNKVNCEYWNTDVNNCKASCKLKNLNDITINFCKNCNERKPIKNKKIIFDKVEKKYTINKIDNSFLNTMRNKNKILQIDPILANELYSNAPHFIEGKSNDNTTEPKRIDSPNSEEVKNILNTNVFKPRPKIKNHPMIIMPEDNDQKEPTFTQKTKNYLAAESSQAIQGKVSEKVFKKRKEICMACEFRVPSAKNATDSIGWCKGGCGCSVGNPRAGLSQKLYMPTLSCPKGKFGEEEGRGFNINDALNSGKGFFKSLASLIKGQKSDK